ncbi:bifunctional folylpolyglutamate synthase/dihydrofolate synthase [Planctomicrobium sp. SH661]|uniref:bifunctional folylpolyglutamate synthase/dihydrofolate synthase n=1 Tax=Planctomicrobium sp. SH661 TaxID=3448124 RepID=UPI003F5B9956
MSDPTVPEVNSCLSDEARYQRAIDEMYGRLNYERTPDAARSLQDFRLTQMRELLAALGNPQLSVKTVHIAGSKGKGSTATMVARIAEAAGHRAGLFTSPHVDRFEERFTINGKTPTQREVADLYDRLRSVIDALPADHPAANPTFFEIATALAWMYFADQQVDLAVMEVGLGGRLDSTNVCSPLVTVITSISRDHVRLLGNTLALIAREKAGIIKPGIPIVTNVPDSDPAEATEEIALANAAPQYRLGVEFHHHPHSLNSGDQDLPAHYTFDFKGFGVDWKNLQLGMPGEHQTRNGALAVAVTMLLRERGVNLPEEAIRQGLKNACCPLRVEVLSRAPLTVVDAAHNPASITALCETLRSVSAKRRIAIFASSRDKEADVLLSILNESMDEIWLTRFTNNPRAIEFAELEAIAARHLTKPWRLFETPQEAISTAQATTRPDDLICITGSFFLAAEAKAILTADG